MSSIHTMTMMSPQKRIFGHRTTTVTPAILLPGTTDTMVVLVDTHLHPAIHQKIPGPPGLLEDIPRTPPCAMTHGVCHPLVREGHLTPDLRRATMAQITPVTRPATTTAQAARGGRSSSHPPATTSRCLLVSNKTYSHIHPRRGSRGPVNSSDHLGGLHQAGRPHPSRRACSSRGSRASSHAPSSSSSSSSRRPPQHGNPSRNQQGQHSSSQCKPSSSRLSLDKPRFDSHRRLLSRPQR